MNQGEPAPPSSRPGGKLLREESEKRWELNPYKLIELSGLSKDKIDPAILDIFTNGLFVANIPSYIKEDEKLIGELVKNTILFHSNLRNGKIFGELIKIPETKHADGKQRREEEGNLILIDKVKELGIDPLNVLYFRRTQPQKEGPKPELYWTSDYFETLTGLQNEISGDQRKNSIILCSTLDDISSDSRLINDINDDNGLPVRRESDAPYDQKRVIFTIKP